MEFKNAEKGGGLANMKDDEDIESKQFKVILLGDGAVGKTSISIRFAEDQFSQM